MIRWAALSFLLLSTPAFGQSIPEPADYKMDHYRGPVPETLKGVTVVDTEAAHQLWTSGEVAFFDVLPRAPKPKNLPEGTLWREKPRKSIPNAIWLPNVGYGAIADITDAYFQDNLTLVTENDLDHPILFFCLMECWMSWNAAKRAVEYGHTKVYWFPDGTDGWTFQDHPMEPLEPEPFD